MRSVWLGHRGLLVKFRSLNTHRNISSDSYWVTLQWVARRARYNILRAVIDFLPPPNLQRQKWEKEKEEEGEKVEELEEDDD